VKYSNQLLGGGLIGYFYYYSTIFILFLIAYSITYYSYKNSYYISLIGILFILYFLFRTIFSYLYHKKFKNYNLINNNPTIAISLPVYNEETTTLKETIDSLLNQENVNIELYIIDDGSKNSADIKKIITSYKNKNIHFHSFDKNMGKRIAMTKSFQLIEQSSNIDYIFTADSDTIYNPKCLFYLSSYLFNNNNLSSITGNVLAKPKSKNIFLNNLISSRYTMAFNLERSSQAFYNGVTCNSGPCTLYRKEVLLELVIPFNNQKFLNRYCTFGDDRNLTNLVLSKKQKTSYHPLAICYTSTPDTFITYIKQQLRWSRSYQRELFFQLQVLSHHSPLMTIDYIFSILLSNLIIMSIFFNYNNLFIYLSIIGIISIIKSSALKYIILKQYNISFSIIYSIIYSYLYMSFLIYIRLYASLTPFKLNWNTRE